MEGIECLTGKLTAPQALAQILVLPGLMAGLALVFAVIRRRSRRFSGGLKVRAG